MKRIALALVLALSFTVAAPACAKKAPTTTPAATAQQAAKLLGVVTKVGLVVEQVQIAEGNLFTAGDVPAAAHAKIQTAFAKTSAAVIAASKALAQAETAETRAQLVAAVAQGLKDISAALGNLSEKHATQLAGWIDTAVALIEIAS